MLVLLLDIKRRTVLDAFYEIKRLKKTIHQQVRSRSLVLIAYSYVEENTAFVVCLLCTTPIVGGLEEAVEWL